jgi:pimeloyl-ACP methyl ester carboxylesterase
VQSRTQDDDSGRTVIVANGFLPFPRPMGRIKAAYRSAGLRPYVVPFSLAQKFDVRLYACDIADAIRQEAVRSGQKVDVVGASMGGLCAFYALAFCDVAPLVRTAVAAAAPFDGTDFTAPGRPFPVLGNSARQMTRGSDLLQNLRRTKLPIGPRYVTIGGLRDRVCPPPTTKFPGTENVLWPCGHLDFMFRTWTHELIAALILSR